ncbi:hexose phosphate transporter [Mesomycoplasma bovoculi]|uniref:Major facilitator protein n=1 Tax=Mesomycoplasma bovoculi M165/69 TaxID=743966 RepID=W5USY0_9BACT|nr:hexose phosphate transporter [Mesomycoplasma bovoculi]AHH45242.1 major facilitator protein [Mesomycoplasma bovoculi M165/69]
MEKQNFLLKFASKNVKVQSLTFSKGVILWALLAFAYLIFVMNWGFASAGLNGKAGLQVNGYLGYLGHFFPDASDAPSSVVNRAVDWGITIGRAIGSILVGWLIVKVSHKYAVIISLVFMLFGIAAPYSPSYAGFIILRTILAIGGTMQIVLLQPVVARYMNQRQKALFSKLSPFFYPIGTIITLLPFVVGEKIKVEIQGQWQTIFLVISLLTLIPLIGYIILGAKFDLYPDAIAARQTAEPLSLFKFFKQKDTWVWALLYGSWLIAVVFPFALSKPLFHRFIGDTTNSYEEQINVFIIVFLAGMFVGPFTVGLISQYQLKRRAFIAGVIGFGVLMYILATITFIKGVATEVPGQYGGYSALFLILGLVMGTCLWGIQGVLLNLPHEYKGANPRKIGYQFGLIWGLGYAFWTIANIITGLVSTPPGVDIKTDASASSNFATGAYVLVIIFSLLAVGAIFLLKEPNPSYPSLAKILVQRKFSEIVKISK